MPTKSERTRVDIKESSSADVRTFDITLTVPLTEFQLTDLLKHRGVIGSLEVDLRVAIKGAVEGYIKAAETLISGLVSKPSMTRRSRPGSNGNSKAAEALSGV